MCLSGLSSPGLGQEDGKDWSERAGAPKSPISVVQRSKRSHPGGDSRCCGAKAHKKGG